MRDLKARKTCTVVGIRENKDIKLALSAYNTGAKAVRKYKGLPPFKKTKNYLEKSLEFFYEI